MAKDGKYFNIAEDPRTFVWTAMEQEHWSSGALMVRTTGNPESLFAAVRSEVQALDPTLPVFEVKTLTEHLRLALFPARIAAMVLGVFGLVALLLSAIGIYGITSYTVAQRTHEIGIRLALGAQWGDVLRLVLNHGLKLTLIGSASDSSVPISQRARSRACSGVSATDPLTFISVSVLLIAVALVACYVPARRATNRSIGRITKRVKSGWVLSA